MVATGWAIEAGVLLSDSRRALGLPGRRVRPARPSGVSLIEVLIAVGVVGILLALLIPAIMSAREASRRAQCLGNLRQLGIALNSYLSRIGSYPDGHGWSGFSVFVALLPDLEYRPLYDSINLTTSGIFVRPENLTAARTQLAVLMCPADGAVATRVRGVSPVNYAGNWGTGVQAGGYNGAFGPPNRASTRPAQITDGTTNTAAFSEWLVGVPGSGRDGRRNVFRTRDQLTEPGQFDAFAEACRTLDVLTATPAPPMSKGSNWMFGDFGFTMYNHTLSPNQNSCTNGTAFQQGAWTAGSNHGGGVHVVMLDSSARFVRETVQLRLWRALGTRNGAEVISSMDF